jgi:hypothetical protein
MPQPESSLSESSTSVVCSATLMPPAELQKRNSAESTGSGMASLSSLMDLRTAEVLKLGLEHFDLPSLAALSATNKCWRDRVQVALQAIAPAVAQQLLLHSAGDTNLRVPPVAVLKRLMERASSIADGAAVECFATTLAIKVISQPGITMTQARVWLSSGLQLSDAAIYAAARSPSAQPGLWVQCHTKMLRRISDSPLSRTLWGFCSGHARVSCAW